MCYLPGGGALLITKKKKSRTSLRLKGEINENLTALDQVDHLVVVQVPEGTILKSQVKWVHQKTNLKKKKKKVIQVRHLLVTTASSRCPSLNKDLTSSV